MRFHTFLTYTVGSPITFTDTKRECNNAVFRTLFFSFVRTAYKFEEIEFRGLI